jgi:hypothetical protein
MEHSVITVVYEQTDDGWHIFTSPQVKTLLIASRDPILAFKDIPIALQKMYRLAKGAEATFEAEMSAEDFFRQIEEHDRRVLVRKAA